MHLYLIGYRGSGKTTVGKALAYRLEWDFVDTDQLIEESAKRTIRDIFAESGEATFRDLETAAIERTAALTANTIISLGGGAVLRDANRQILARSGRCVWLRAPAELLYERISGDTLTAQRRPNLSAIGGYAEVVELLARREPIYEQLADLQVMIEGLAPDQIVAKIAEWASSTPDGCA